MPCLLRAAAQALLKHDKLVVHHDLLDLVVAHGLEHRARAGLVRDHCHVAKRLGVDPLVLGARHDDLPRGGERVGVAREEVLADDLRGGVAAVGDDVGGGGGGDGEGGCGGAGVVDGEGGVEDDFGLLVEAGELRPLRERVVGVPGAEAAGAGGAAEGGGGAAVGDVVERAGGRALGAELFFEAAELVSLGGAVGDGRGLVDLEELVLDDLTVGYTVIK
mmetsp:Transcript_10439/g.27383  ORF Transcript_10439/g.27383 Transcript_10439/m.27383 type:complete len:219 (-) Transcript_10439:324-980(-)